MPPAGFEPAIPGSEQPQTHVLDRAATGIGFSNEYLITKCMRKVTGKLFAHIPLFMLFTSQLKLYRDENTNRCKTQISRSACLIIQGVS